jgi:hypothetical protein
MQYRPFGKLDWQVSALGFGCMRLPTVNGERTAPILEAEAIQMIRGAINAGVNYLDTAYVYHEGQSEVLLGKALADGYRDIVKIADKLPIWLVQAPDDFDRLLNEQLARLGTDHIDFYLLHALDKNRWRNTVLRHKLLDKALAAKADGRIHHIGFSFHDDFAGFEEIVNGTNIWEFCQIQYNYMDIENQAGRRGLKLAAAKGLAVIIMEPLLGGRLAEPPAEVRELMNASDPSRTPADWALGWLWNQPEVSLLLSGMSTPQQVTQNLASADRAHVGSMTAAELAMIDRVREIYLSRTAIPCTNCGYCMPCPNGVNIPTNFEFFNYAHLYDNTSDARFRYNIFLPEAQRSSACIQCGFCEENCPQQIVISEWMPQVTELLA